MSFKHVCCVAFKVMKLLDVALAWVNTFGWMGLTMTWCIPKFVNDIWGRKIVPIFNIAMECKPMACSLTLIKKKGVGILGWD